MSDPDIRRRLDRLVRAEYGRLVASLVNRLGGHKLELAEDVAQEALLAALATWPYRGVPDHPAAWLRTVARNRAIDRLRRSGREADYDERRDPRTTTGTDNVFAARIADPELRLIFLCCHPDLNEADRLALTLKVVGGFTAREISGLLLKPETAIAQRLARAKRRLREDAGRVALEPSRFEINERLATVQKVIYLAFSLGHAPRAGERLVRHDVCLEALRLARELADHELTGTPAARALAALLCFQASRLGAREDAAGRPVLMRDQDRSTWDGELIAAGLRYLQGSRSGPPGRFHLEAGIASLHAAATDWETTDWQAMLELYRPLERLTGSPVVTVNACVTQAMAGQPRAALERLDALSGHPQLAEYGPYFVARAEILALLDEPARAARSFERALACRASRPVAEFLAERLRSCL